MFKHRITSLAAAFFALSALSAPLLAMENCTPEHAAMGHCELAYHQTSPSPSSAAPSHDLPTPTEADLQAAFPDLGGMDLRKKMATPLLSYTLFDQLEWGEVDSDSLFAWNALGWIGYDNNRLWWRTEGERLAGHTESAELSLLYGRPIHRWWDLVVGLRHDFKPDDPQAYLAFGFQGLAPQWFETELTLFIGEGSQALFRAEFEYELLLTQRLILTPDLEVNFATRNDPQRGIGSGLMNAEWGFRLRYEIVREFAPYIGYSRTQRYGATADMAGEQSESAWLLGVRLWW